MKSCRRASTSAARNLAGVLGLAQPLEAGLQGAPLVLPGEHPRDQGVVLREGGEHGLAAQLHQVVPGQFAGQVVHGGAGVVVLAAGVAGLAPGQGLGVGVGLGEAGVDRVQGRLGLSLGLLQLGDAVGLVRLGFERP